MSDKNENRSVEEGTSFGTYLLKELYQTAVALVGSIGGAYAGILAAKPLGGEPIPEFLGDVLKKLPGFKTSAPKTTQLALGGGAGLFLGSLLSAICLGYGHWKKVAQAQLQVDEITRNISDIEVFQKTNPELKAENARLWTELHAREKASGHAPVKQAESWTEKAAISPEAMGEVAR